MLRWSKKWSVINAVLVAALGLAVSVAHAQAPCLPAPLPNCPAPGIAPSPQYTPPQGTPDPNLQQPGTTDQQQSAAADMGAPTPRYGGAGIGATTEGRNPGGYIDPAAPMTQFRIRFDAMQDDNRPDRADFFYAKCGCFKLGGLDPNAKGPPNTTNSVNNQELTFYTEYAASERFSGFFELPLRFIQYQGQTTPPAAGVPDTNWGGLSDVNFGFKYAVVYNADSVVSLQLRTYAPTGDPFKGLGTNNWVLEPALLFEHKISERVTLLGEFRDTIPVGSEDDFAGNVVRYGIGVSYLAYCGDRLRVTPVLETVGWTCLNGKELALIPGGSTILNAAGDTIINVKFGARFNFGDRCEGGNFVSHSDLYVGYGRAVTGDVWYKDIFRVEYRLRF